MGLTGLIFDIKRFSVNDGPGIRTTVFFKGCPLACRWCHNPESREFCKETMVVVERLGEKEFSRTKEIGTLVSVAEVMREIEKESIFYETSGGGVTFSGGEPLLQPEFLSALTTACRQKGIHTCLDTSGQCETPLFKSMMQHFDLFLYDIKVLDPQSHMRWTGSENGTILNNLKILDASGKTYIIRVPLIPGVNLGRDNIDALLDFAKQLTFPSREIHFLPYHPMGKNKLKKLGIQDTMDENLKVTDEEISAVSGIFGEAGFTVKIGG
ncbi:MAG TPA: glycyl-radical enzyme activating protein [Bacteroidales bacterium]|nr:glycyl-radical enzyme activating protein [Bacteroidales bacterium]